MRAPVSFWAALPCRMGSVARRAALCAGLVVLVPQTARATGKSLAAPAGPRPPARVGPGRGAGEPRLDSVSEAAEGLTETERPAESGIVAGEDAELRALAQAER